MGALPEPLARRQAALLRWARGPVKARVERFLRTRPSAKTDVFYSLPRASPVAVQREPAKGKRLLHDLRRKFGLQRLRLALRNLVLHRYMEPFATRILLRQHAVEMLGNHGAQPQHSFAFQPDRGSAAKVQEARNARIDRRKLPGKLPHVLDYLPLAETRQRVEQRDMGGKIVALWREMRLAQPGRPALQSIWQLSREDERQAIFCHLAEPKNRLPLFVAK